LLLSLESHKSFGIAIPDLQELDQRAIAFYIPPILRLLLSSYPPYKALPQEGFTILRATDQNLRYQQNLQQAGVAVVVLVASSNRLPDLVPLIPDARMC
jgi:acetyl esterase/lipase